MRITLSVDKTWTVSSSLLNLPPRYLAKKPDDDGDTVPTLDAARHPAEAIQGLIASGANAISEAYWRLMKRAIDLGDPEAFGGYLFDCLLGPNWTAVQEAAKQAKEWFIELALSWDADDVALSRLPWELMRSPGGYLSNGYVRGNRRVDVAITRVVPHAGAAPRQIEGLPRVLFAVGASLNDSSVRPAAEILCMLKRTRENRRMHPRMLERTSPSRLKEAIASFRPDVVHLICHGGIAGGVPFLLLQSETSGTEEQFTAEPIATALKAGGVIPPIVLLSACQSGTAMLGPQAVAPFAAQLVKLGIPIVIGMSGKVSDIACRLFTRRFAESLMGAGRLIEATAEGRRAAFTEGKAPEKSIDWAFPAVFLSTAVAPDYQPAASDAPPDPTESQIRAYNLRSLPTFCGRQDFFQEFQTLFAGGGSAVLAAYTTDGTAGFGRKRLLEEFAVQAILDGHIPILVTSRTWKDSQQPPNTPLKLALEIDRAVDTASRAFGVKLSPLSPAKRLLRLVENKFDAASLAGFSEEMQAALLGSNTEVTAEGALLAIEQRLTDLIANARTEYRKRMEEAGAKAAASKAAGVDDPVLNRLAAQAAAESQAMNNARAVVLLDSIQLYDAALKALLSHQSLSDTGLGTKEYPVPLVVTFSLKTTADVILDQLVQNQSAYPGWRFLPLKPFEPGGERLLVYTRILLNPFDDTIVENISGQAWFMDDLVDPEVRDRHIRRYDTRLRGLPGEFLESKFYLIAEFAKEENFLKPANDDLYIAQLEAEQARLKKGGQ